MIMESPAHPGEFILETYMRPFKFSCRFLAKKLDVAPSTLNRILKCQSAISPEMALRLAKSLGRTPQSWLAMQDNYDLWQASQYARLDNVEKVEISAI